MDPLFLEHYRMLLPFSSTDSTRHILQSVCCEKTKEDQLMVATDGRRLTTANSISFPLSKTAIIPKNKFLAWPQLKGETRIGVHAKNNWMRLTCGEWDASVRLIEGAYPNWRQSVETELNGKPSAEAPMSGKPAEKASGKVEKASNKQLKFLTDLAVRNGYAVRAVCCNAHYTKEDLLNENTLLTRHARRYRTGTAWPL